MTNFFITVISGLESHLIVTYNELEKSLTTEKINLAFVTRYFLALTCNEITYTRYKLLFSLSKTHNDASCLSK